MKIRIADTEDQLRRCFPVMVQLRPHLSESEFITRALRQAAHYGYIVGYVEDEGHVRAVVGFRVTECLSTGRFLYVDDLVADEAHRSRGFGETLFDWIVNRARDEGCEEITLDSGVQRHAAHRFYFRKRMRVSGHHFSLKASDAEIGVA